MSLREEKANALGVAEAEKLSLRRRFQAELQELQRNKEETVSELERDKASLRDKWQAAMEEMGILQAQMVAAEERFKEELRARCAMFEDEKAEARRQCYDELGRLLEEKATEAARQSLDTAQLQRRLDEATANADQEKANLLARLEAEKATLQSQLQEVCNEKLRLSEEKAALAERQTSDLAKAQETWAGAFARELRASRELQREEATRLQTLVKSVSERHEESERQTSMLQAELAALQQHWPSSPPPKARWPTSPRREREGEGEGGSDPPSPKEELPPEVKQPEGEAQTETEPEGEFFPQGRDRRDLPRLGLPRRYPEMWSPSFKDLAEARGRGGVVSGA
ncbi:unnamed protein product [Effrenium voratum]|nr:unnamed protein product [Effrenium voratum]